MSDSLQRGALSLGGRIARAMLIIVFFHLFWKFGGFLVSGVLIGTLFGSGAESDAFFSAHDSVVFLIFLIGEKLLGPAFLPVFIEERRDKGEKAAWDFANSSLNLLVLTLFVLIATGIVFAPQICHFAAAGYFVDPTDPRGPLTIRLVRLMFPGLLGLSVGSLTYVILNGYKVFSYPAAGDSVQKLVWALVLFVTFKLFGLGAMAIAIGFLAGAAGKIITHLIGLHVRVKAEKLYRLRIPFWREPARAAWIAGREAAGVGLLTFLVERANDQWFGFSVLTDFFELAPPAACVVVYILLRAGWTWKRLTTKPDKTPMERFFVLAFPLLIGILFAKFRDLMTDRFATFLSLVGQFSDIKYAKKIGDLPTAIVPYALSMAMFPFLCELASKKDLATFGTVVDRALRMIALFFVPMTVGVILLREPLIRLVYDHGAWEPIHVHYAGLALGCYVCALFFYAAETVVMQSFFSMQNTWLPTLAGIAFSMLQVLYLYVGIRVLDWNAFLVVATAFPFSRVAKNVLLMGFLRVRVPILPFRRTIVFAMKLGIVTLGVGLAAWGTHVVLDRMLDLDAARGKRVALDVPSKAVEAYTWDLSALDLKGMDRINLSVSTDRPVDLAFSLQTKNGRTFVKEYKIRAAQQHIGISLPLNRFRPKERPDAKARPKAVACRQLSLAVSSVTGEGVARVLIASASFAEVRLREYEIAKVVHVIFPSIAGAGVFVVLVFLLRIEEAGILLDWFRRRGWKAKPGPPGEMDADVPDGD